MIFAVQHKLLSHRKNIATQSLNAFQTPIGKRAKWPDGTDRQR